MTIKLYEATKRFGNTTYIGVVLVGDHNQVYLEQGFSTNRENHAYLSGIERAVSFIHNNKPLHVDGDMVVYGQKICLNDPLTSEYIQKVLPNKRIVSNTSELTDSDKAHLYTAHQQVEQMIYPIELRMMNQNSQGIK